MYCSYYDMMYMIKINEPTTPLAANSHISHKGLDVKIEVTTCTHIIFTSWLLYTYDDVWKGGFSLKDIARVKPP